MLPGAGVCRRGWFRAGRGQVPGEPGSFHWAGEGGSVSDGATWKGDRASPEGASAGQRRGQRRVE